MKMHLHTFHFAQPNRESVCMVVQCSPMFFRHSLYRCTVQAKESRLAAADAAAASAGASSARLAAAAAPVHPAPPRRHVRAASVAEDILETPDSSSHDSDDDRGVMSLALVPSEGATEPAPPMSSAMVTLAMGRRRAARTAISIQGPSVNLWHAGTFEGSCWTKCGAKDRNRGKV